MADAKTAGKPATPKAKKEPKPLMQRMDEQLTRAAVGKKVTHEELAKFETRVGRLKAFLEVVDLSKDQRTGGLCAAFSFYGESNE